jgi:hypothetical protein
MIILEGGGRFSAVSTYLALRFFAAVRGKNGMEKPLFFCLSVGMHCGRFTLRASLCIAKGVYEWDLEGFDISLVRDSSNRAYGRLNN